MLDIEALSEMMAGVVADEVAKAVAPLNVQIAALEARDPVAGPPGEKGEPGEPGQPGENGADGKDGADGCGVKNLLIDQGGALVATLDDGTMKTLGVVCGRDGKDGENGVDGKSTEELTEDDEILISATLRKEIGDHRLIELPDPFLPPSTTAPPQVNVTVENHLPKRGREKTVVTDYDERGRIAAYERFEA